MKRLVSFLFLLLLTACGFNIGTNPSGGDPVPVVDIVPMPTLTAETVVASEVTIDQTSWVIWNNLLGLDGCTVEAKVVSMQEKPLMHTLEEGWTINGDTPFDLNLGVFGACMAEKIGGLMNDEVINQSLGMVYSYVAKSLGLPYEQYAQNVTAYGANALPEDTYNSLFLGVDVSLPVTIKTKPMQISP